MMRIPNENRLASGFKSTAVHRNLFQSKLTPLDSKQMTEI